MHDFIQNLSFSSQSPFPAARAVSEPLRRLTQSFNEIPSYRLSPRAPARRKLPVRLSRKS
jgi:hypothetical protein